MKQTPCKRLFGDLTPSIALKMLRACLRVCGIEDAFKYRMHDFRRGHAQDLLDSGASLAEMLSAGQWRSPAFLRYIAEETLERDAIVQAHLEESSDEDDDVQSSENNDSSVMDTNEQRREPEVIDIEDVSVQRKALCDKLEHMKQFLVNYQAQPMLVD